MSKRIFKLLLYLSGLLCLTSCSCSLMLFPPKTICSELLCMVFSDDCLTCFCFASGKQSPVPAAVFTNFPGDVSCSLSCPTSTPESSRPAVTFLAAAELSFDETCVEESPATKQRKKHVTLYVDIRVILPLPLPNLICNSPYCLPYNSHDISLENLVLDWVRILLTYLFLFISSLVCLILYCTEKFCLGHL